MNSQIRWYHDWHVSRGQLASPQLWLILGENWLHMEKNPTISRLVKAKITWYCSYARLRNNGVVSFHFARFALEYPGIRLRNFPEFIVAFAMVKCLGKNQRTGRRPPLKGTKQARWWPPQMLFYFLPLSGFMIQFDDMRISFQMGWLVSSTTTT